METVLAYYNLCDEDMFTDTQDISIGKIDELIEFKGLIQIHNMKNILPKEFMKLNRLYLLCILWKDSDTEVCVMYSLESGCIITWCTDVNTLYVSNLDPLDLALMIIQNLSTNDILKLLLRTSITKHIIEYKD